MDRRTLTLPTCLPEPVVGPPGLNFHTARSTTDLRRTSTASRPSVPEPRGTNGSVKQDLARGTVAAELASPNQYSQRVLPGVPVRPAGTWSCLLASFFGGNLCVGGLVMSDDYIHIQYLGRVAAHGASQEFPRPRPGASWYILHVSARRLFKCHTMEGSWRKVQYVTAEWKPG